MDSRRTYREKMAKKKVSSTGQKSGFSCRSSQKTLNATDSEEIYGTDDCSGDDVHGVSEHPRSSTSRSAAIGPQLSGLDRSSGQGNSHRLGASLSPNRSKRGSSKKIVSQSSSGQDVSELFLLDTGHSLVTGRCQNSPDTRLPDRSVSEIIPGTDRNISGQSSQGTGSKDKSRKSTAHGTGQPDITGYNHSADSGRFHRTGQPVRTRQPDNFRHQQNKSGHNRGLTDNLSSTPHNISNNSVLIYEPENHSNNDRSVINNSRQRATTSRDSRRGGKHTPSLVRSLFYSHSRSRSRSHSKSVKSRRSRSHAKKLRKHTHRSDKRKRYSSSSYSSSSSSSSPHYHHRRKRRHRSRSPQPHKRSHKRNRSSSSSSRSPRVHKSRVDSLNTRPIDTMQSGRSSVLPQKRQNSSPIQHDTSQELSIRVRNNDFDVENVTHNTSRVSRSPSSGEENESFVGIKFPQVIEEIYKLLPEDKFPRKENSSAASIPKPKSSIEEEIAKQESPSVSLPQSHLLVNTMNFIQDQMKKDHSPEDWVVQRKDMNSLVRTKFYQSHNNKVPVSKEVPLDQDANKLNLSLSGTTSIPVKNLNSFESQLRNLLQILSHADIFSYAAYRSLCLEKMDPPMLKRILESLAMSINHSVSLASYLTVEIQQARREAAIRSAPKSLSDLAKIRLRSAPIVSESLFAGKIDEIYKENTETLTNNLISRTVTSSQNRIQQSSGSTSNSQNRRLDFKKPQSKSQTFRSRRDQKKIPSKTSSDPSRGGSSYIRGFGKSVRGAPSRRGPLTVQDNEVPPPLPHPQPMIPVGGRLAHFAHFWQNITSNQWVFSIVKRGYRIPFKELPPLSSQPIFFHQSQRPELAEEVNNLLQKRAVEEIIPESPGFYSRIFLVPKKNGKLRLIIDLSTLNHYGLTQSFRMETQKKVRNSIHPKDWAFSLDLTDAYLHVLIHPMSRKYLRFTLNNKIFQFRALSFGLSTSPFVFTQLYIYTPKLFPSFLI